MIFLWLPGQEIIYSKPHVNDKKTPTGAGLHYCSVFPLTNRRYIVLHLPGHSPVEHTFYCKLLPKPKAQGWVKTIYRAICAVSCHGQNIVSKCLPKPLILSQYPWW